MTFDVSFQLRRSAGKFIDAGGSETISSLAIVRLLESVGFIGTSLIHSIRSEWNENGGAKIYVSIFLRGNQNVVKKNMVSGVGKIHFEPSHADRSS